MKNMSIVRKLIFGTSFLAIIIAGIATWIAVCQISDLTEENAHSALSEQISDKAEFARGYFQRYQAIVDVFLSNSDIRTFAQQRTSEDIPYDTPLFKKIQGDIKTLADQDQKLITTFFAVGSTGEYYDLSGRYFDPKVNLKSRPWWQRSIKEKKPWLTTAIDIRTGNLSGAIYSPVYDQTGKLLYIGGADIDVTGIQKSLLDDLRYQGAGIPFVFNEKGDVVLFSGKKPEELKSLTLNKLDQQGEGFSSLVNVDAQYQTAFKHVTWMGQEQVLAVRTIKSEWPNMQWSLALMVPATLINEPVKSATMSALFFAAVCLSMLVAAIGVFAKRALLPLNNAAEAMREIAQGDGDLRQRLDNERKDEVGQVASAFNLFTEKIHHLVSDSTTLAGAVQQNSEEMQRVVVDTHDAINAQKNELELIAAAATEMGHAVNEISNNADRTREMTSDAETLVSNGKASVSASTSKVEQLTADIISAEQMVTQLRQDVDQIGQILNVIGDIAEQTNLLALNAAIEAARAGDQGRGFAVVASEVRNLASKTQESTISIREIIEKLQSQTHQVDAVMSQNRSQANDTVESAREQTQLLEKMMDAITGIQAQAEQIACATAEQTQVVADISQNVNRVNDLSTETAGKMDKAVEETQNLNANNAQLQSSMNQFTV
ncbi:methyl-accepting chemotaxis protein [Veronia pacifica]|uniref:Chemotaxis protein n=1 Tax=Veronia pacifica TaxID=1080227 RepID=A0A1C3EDH3_9GAMM|nr:methyl-accepting chemotaxis protein [Veronia pacifica]ODA31296.1 hypothetical protein A8L45_17545 [Veronia pacifica]